MKVNSKPRLIGVTDKVNLLTGYATANGPSFTFEAADIGDIDGLGRLRDADETLTNTGGTVTHNLDYTYDMRSQLTSASIDKDGQAWWTGNYTYHDNGDMASRTIQSSQTSFTYTGNQMATARGGESFDLDYDENGNMIDGVSSTLEYNWDNKLRSATKTDTISLKYDPLGNRIFKDSSVSGIGARKYIVDIVGDLPVILMEIDTADSSVKKTYIYANSQILAQHDGDYNATRYFYLHDRLGSVRQIIKSYDTYYVELVSHYTYNPFGELFPTEFSEGVSNPFKFTGQYFDDEIGQYYLRARMYDPHLYRFISRDIIDGRFEQPLTLHKYLYCLNDPINKIDPIGLNAYYFTGGALASLGYSLAAQTGIVWDDKGNWGIIGIAQEGGGWPATSVGFSYGWTSAPTILDLEGPGWALGLGGGSFFDAFGGGAELIWGEGYYGLEFSIGGGVQLGPAEGHLHRTHNYIVPVHSETLTFEDVVGMAAEEAFWQSDTYGEYRFMLQFMIMTDVDIDVLMF